MKSVSRLAEVDAFIDTAPRAPRRSLLEEHFADAVRYPRASREAELGVLSWPNRYGINRISYARNSLHLPLVRAGDTHTALSAFEWWAA
jgi:hypothetical protein